MSDQQLPDFYEPERRRSPHLIPWITVGLVAVIAIVASAIVLNLMRGGADTNSNTNTDANSSTDTSDGSNGSGENTGSDTNNSGQDAENDSEDDSASAEKPPTVEIGQHPTMLPIADWGVEAPLSQKFGAVTFIINNGTDLVLTSDWINSLPESCAAMREQFGITKVSDSKFVALRPATTCTAQPQLFNEIWGQLTASAKAITPAG